MAKAEKIDRGYLGRILLLTLLAHRRGDSGWAPAYGAGFTEADETVPGAVG
jgi:hypothetical protein